MLKSKTILGIDIGTVTIKIVEMEEGKNCPRLVNYAVFPIPPLEENDSFSEDERLKRIIFLLKNILKEKKIKSTNAAIAISSQSVFTRFVKMPFSDPKKLERLINFEAQQQIPFPLEEVSWDYQIVGKTSEEENVVLIAAIKQDMLNKQFKALSTIGISPTIFDVGALATYNSLIRGQIKSDSKTIIIDVGANPAVMIIHQPDGYWVRTLSYSSVGLTQSLMKQFQISYDEAEALKFKGFIINENAKPKDPDDISFKINYTITQNARKLYTEIVRSLNFYKTQFVDVEFDNILLCGGGCKLDNLKLYLSTKFQMSVTYADPLINIEISKGLDISEIEEVAYLFCEPIGLAIRQLTDCKVQLNLMTIAANIETTFKKYLKYVFISFFVIILALGYSIYDTNLKLKTLNEKKEEILREHDSLKKLKSSIADELSKNNSFEKELGIFHNISIDKGIWLTFYIELCKIIPKEIYLQFLSITSDDKNKEKGYLTWNEYPNIVLISGIAESTKILDAFKEKLKEIEIIKEIEMQKASIKENKEIEFELKLKL